MSASTCRTKRWRVRLVYVRGGSKNERCHRFRARSAVPQSCSSRRESSETVSSLFAKDRPSLRFTPDGELHVTERMPPHRLVARRLTSAVPVRIRALLPARPPCMPCATGLHAILAAVLAIPSSRLKNCDKAARVAQECFSSRQPVDHLGRRRRPSRASCHLTDASNRSMQLPHGQPCPHDSGQQQQARAREQRRPSLRLRLERALKRPVRRF